MAVRDQPDSGGLLRFFFLFLLVNSASYWLQKDALHPIPRRLAISRQSHPEIPKAIFHSLKPDKP